VVYLLLVPAFSLLFFLPVKFNFTLLKRKADEYIKLEINFFVSKMLIEIPKMKFTIKSLVPILGFEYRVGSKNIRKLKSGKTIISPVRDNFKLIIDSIKFLFKYFNTFKRLIISIFNKIKLIKLNIDVSFGCENPALTGFWVGQIWSIIFQSLGLLSLYLNIEGADIKAKVTPDFIERKPFQMKINCIFHLRVGDIIIASLMLVWYLLKFKVGSKLNRRQYD